MASRFSIEAVFKAVDRMTAPVTRMQNRVGQFTRSMETGMRRLDRRVDRFNTGLRSVGRTATLVTGLVVGLLGNAVQAGAGFEQAIVDVGAVSLQTREQIAPLEQMALELGRSTKFTSTQAANAMEIMARAGFSMNEILGATPAVLSAAAASGLEIAEVADHVSNVLKGMALETSDAARVADVLALASARTNSTIGSLGESMKNVAATARQLGIPLEEVVAGVALLQDVGLDASVAGSAFNVMLTKMASPSREIETVMNRLGVSFKDVNGNMKDFPTVLSEISRASASMGGNFDQVAFVAELVGLRGQKAASNLAMLFETGKLETLVAELENAAGSAEQMATLRMDTFQGSLLLLGSAVDAVKVKIFGLNNGPLKDTVDQMTAWVSANEDLIANKIGGFLSSLIENLATIAKWGATGLTVIAVIVAFTAVLKTFILVMTAVNLVMALNPFGLIVLAVVAVIAAVAAMIIWWEDLKAIFMGLPGPIRVAIGLAMLPIMLLVAAVQTVINNWSQITEFFARLWGKVVSIFNAMPLPLKAAIAVMLGPIGVLALAAKTIMDNWEPLKTFFIELWGAITTTIETSVARIMAIIEKVKAAVSTVTATVDRMGDFAGGVGDNVGNFFGGVGDRVGSLFGRNDEDEAQARPSPQVVNPQQALLRSLDERVTREKSEITLRDETGRAEVTSGSLGSGVRLLQTGAL